MRTVGDAGAGGVREVGRALDDLLVQARQHDQHPAALLPHHAPEVRRRCRQRALRGKRRASRHLLQRVISSY